MSIKFEITKVTINDEPPMTWAAFEEKLHKARAWSSDRTTNWWKTHGEAEQLRQEAKYMTLEEMTSLVELAESTFNSFDEGEASKNMCLNCGWYHDSEPEYRCIPPCSAMHFTTPDSPGCYQFIPISKKGETE